jgi:hypothetical protein
MSAFDESEGNGGFGSYDFSKSGDDSASPHFSTAVAPGGVYQLATAPSEQQYQFSSNPATDVAVRLAMQHQQQIMRGTQVAAAYAIENRDVIAEQAMMHGPGIQQAITQNGPGTQRPLDWQSPQNHQGGRSGVPSQYELQERWNRALQEEERLRKLAGEVEAKERSVSGAIRRLTPNFPRKVLCLSPVVHHDIEFDIPEDRRKFMKITYGQWWATVAMLSLNFIMCLIVLLLPNKNEDVDGNAKSTSQHVGLAAGYLLGIPMSFVVWYWQVYKACMLRKSATYVAAFVGLAIAFLFAAFMAIGLVGLGGTGILFAVHVSDAKGSGAAVPVIILCCCWIAQCCLFAYLMFRLRQYYKADGASLEEAKRQVAAGAARSYSQNI